MNDLFDKNLKNNILEKSPLAERMRPFDFESFFGQERIIGKESPLRRSIQNDNVRSLILWGPPGSGKTTLAKIIAKKTKAEFVKISAVQSGVKDIRKIIEESRERIKFYNKKTILFIDEIHRFNKAQQDVLLPHVENGTVVLIGATTENPSFEVISPLLSRSSVYILESLSEDSLKKILQRALKDKEKGLGSMNFNFEDKALEKIISFSDGDARVALNALEFISDYLNNEGKKEIEEKDVDLILKEHALRYDKKGEEHYNLISAFIKSMRDSEPSASLYWLARMIESGEDPKFIARRMVIFASEDIGNKDINALNVAISVSRAVEFVGMPEAQINLAQGTDYLSRAPKNNNSYKALLKAKEDAKKGSFGVPLYLRNASTSLMKKIGYGKNYNYIHEKGEKNEFHFPKEIGKKDYYKEA
jgi:putative ATPase